MDRGESQFIGDCFLPVDISDGQVRPDATPVIRFESTDEEEDNDIKDEEGMSSEPEGLSKAPRKGTTIKRYSRSKMSLHLLTRRFLQLMQEAPGCSVDLTHVTTRLQTHRRRLYDITSTLYGIQVIEKESKNRVRWIGKHPISVFLSNKCTELQRLKQVESTLDGLIKRCAQQLFDMTDNLKYSTWAYVTHEDIRLLQTFQEQTVIAVRAPEESKLEIPVPTEDSVQVHLTANRQPFIVLTCELGSGHDADGSACFLDLEESRIRTKIQSTDSRGSTQDMLPLRHQEAPHILT
ncbi:transcription factor E2F6-like [Takifugu flavidus]|uniref:transcription factor E2F6-like n=1 Tax=Takifugu flavidus TaxID=433684 RepID=UPI0025442E70|nr:transcription factor E2F6-like [Takifugu flavidus]XP_056873016.1 transcription factor E2F6-like [Takifugu flavidus]